MERIPEQVDATKNVYTNAKAKLGRLASRAAVVVTATATFFGGVVAAEAATNSDKQAHASPFDSMNGAEKAWCAWPSRWELCTRAQMLANDSLKAATSVAVSSERRVHNGDADAFRHCYWSGLMTKGFGWETAKGFGDRHEYNDDQHPFETEADLYNNRQGRIWAQEVEDIGRRCLDGMLNGELQIVIPYQR